MIDVKKKLKKVWLIIIILLIVIGVFVFILLKNSNKKIDNSFSVTKEKYSVDSTLKKNETYDLNISENIENSNLKTKKDIKEIKYEVNK